MKKTLTAQLFLRILPTVLLTLVLIAVLALYSSRREINYVYDMQMANDANVLWNLVEDELKESAYKNVRKIDKIDADENAPGWDKEADEYGSARMFRIWRNGRLVMYSDTALPIAVPRQKAGFADITYKRKEWRIYTMEIPAGKITLEIGEKRTLRNTLVWNILIDLFIPLLLVVPFLGLGLWSGIRKGLRAIQELVQQIHSRSPEDLSAIRLSSLPRDLGPLGNAINRLFTKLAHSINAERRFADHAAHQLRTPLAGSRLLIQMLESADDQEERNAILADLAMSNHRASELVSKLLFAARVSHQPITLAPVALYPLVARLIAEIAPMAVHKSLAVSLQGDEQATVFADETLLSVMVVNLVENAIKYTPEEGSVAVSISSEAAASLLTVTDSGPGIAEHERLLVFQRFYRAEMADNEGTGIGLAIVADIVERLKGSILLNDAAPGPGLCVEVRLPKQ